MAPHPDARTALDTAAGPHAQPVWQIDRTEHGLSHVCAIQRPQSPPQPRP